MTWILEGVGGNRGASTVHGHRVQHAIAATGHGSRKPRPIASQSRGCILYWADESAPTGCTDDPRGAGFGTAIVPIGWTPMAESTTPNAKPRVLVGLSAGVHHLRGRVIGAGLLGRIHPPKPGHGEPVSVLTPATDRIRRFPGRRVQDRHRSDRKGSRKPEARSRKPKTRVVTSGCG
jgi:hypothetical protein